MFSASKASKSSLRSGVIVVLVVCLVVTGLIWRQSTAHELFGDRLRQHAGGTNKTQPGDIKQRKAAFVVLTDPRENHFENVIPMLAQVESKYGWTNRDYFIFIDGSLPSEEVRNATSIATHNKSRWLLLSEEHGWGKPDWIPSDILNNDVPKEYHHFFPVGYHNMCRFYSGFAYSHPALVDYDWFWRLDSNVQYLCVPPFDPAQYMIDRDLDYGFLHALDDAEVTLVGFEDMLKNFLKLPGINKLIHPKSNYRRWLFDKFGRYNHVCFYNNFEIISRRFFESPGYQKWFNYIDRNTTGFYQSRWGDAAIRAAGVSMFADPSKVAWFGRQIGYLHEWIVTVPEQPWNSLYCDEMPSMEFKVPGNDHKFYHGDHPPIEPEFQAHWLYGL